MSAVHSAWSVQRQLAARFDGEVAGGAVADFFFVISGSGRTMELGQQIDPLGPRRRPDRRRRFSF
jgi:hypothetical protein